MSQSDTAFYATVEPCLGVVIPAFNEAATIASLIRSVLAQPLVREVIVVDDASRDGTWDALQRVAKESPAVRVFQHAVNQGKGAAVRTGFAQVTAPLAIVQDADLEYDPEDYPKLCRPILTGKAQVVVGSRFLGTGEHRVLYYWHSVGNRVLTTLSNMATGINLSDMESGYKVFKREVIQNIRIEEGRFGFEPEIVAKVSKLKVVIYEVPISYYGRTYAEGKKIGWRDAVSALRCIIKYNFFR
ncbi:MAG TPA: glycosyltransferase family 2 protein [Verrucomicrobiae bacterium]|jgi:glycosyltransferase involved in cell wall biosynthesis